MIFKRKIYNRLLEWKKESNGKSAILIEGARRIGKSTIVEEFARNEYETYLLIDFSKASNDIKNMFDDIMDLDMLFTQLQFKFNIRLLKRKSAIIFDEVQFCPKARQAIKHLVADGRFDYIETGSLISIHRNVKDILIPSEEEAISMYPLDYEEFRWALGDYVTCDLLREAIKTGKPNGQAVHRKLMRDFRLYMLVGGMPQAINEYLMHHNMELVDKIKRQIIKLYESDFIKIDESGRLSQIFDSIPAQLGRNVSRYMAQSAIGKVNSTRMEEMLAELANSKTVNICYHTNDPSNGLAMDFNKDYYKMFICDTGLFITLAFKDKDFTENIIYSKLLSDKLDANLGYVYENVVAQILVSQGRRLFYYTFPTETSRHTYEIDFLISAKDKIDPIEVKSSGYKSHSSLDAFCKKYSAKIHHPFIIYTKDVFKEGNIRYLPVYMLPFIDAVI